MYHLFEVFFLLGSGLAQTTSQSPRCLASYEILSPAVWPGHKVRTCVIIFQDEVWRWTGCHEVCWNTAWASTCITGTTIFCWCYSSFNLETRSYTVAGEVALQPPGRASCQIPKGIFWVLVLPQMSGTVGVLYQPLLALSFDICYG